MVLIVPVDTELKLESSLSDEEGGTITGFFFVSFFFLELARGGEIVPVTASKYFVVFTSSAESSTAVVTASF